MSATNNNCGFTVPQGPREKLTAIEARKRFEDGLKQLEDDMAEAKRLIDELEALVS
jgi:hypothetical protein